MAGLHERLGNRHAVAAADVQNPRVGWKRRRDRECFRDTHGPAAIRRIPIGNQIVLTHALRVRLYTSRSHLRAVKAQSRSVARKRVISRWNRALPEQELIATTPLSSVNPA
jgi:hypothetical protein